MPNTIQSNKRKTVFSYWNYNMDNFQFNVSHKKLSFDCITVECRSIFGFDSNYNWYVQQSQYKQKLLFQFHKHHVPKGKSSRSKCNLSQMLFTPNNLYVKYFILLWVYQVLYIRFIWYHTENIVHVHSDRTRTFLYKYVTRILFQWFG